jgi:general secretion pathway protein M
MILDDWRNTLQSKLSALAPRERQMVIGAAVAVLAILLLSLWLPMQRELSQLRKSVPQEKVQLAQMQVQAMQVNQLRASGRVAISGSNLLANLEQSANTSGLRQRITRMEPDGTNGARLTLDGVNFDALVSWLAGLQNQGGVRVEKATLESLPAAGTVNARLTLRGTGS